MRHVEVNHAFTCSSKSNLEQVLWGDESFNQAIFEVMDYKGRNSSHLGKP